MDTRASTLLRSVRIGENLVHLDRMRLRARNAGAAMSEHQTIWLQPWCDECQRRGVDRTWCQDAVYDPCDCGAMPVKYVIAADQPQKPEPEADEE